MKRSELRDYLIEKSSYLRWSPERVAKQFGVHISVAVRAMDDAKEIIDGMQNPSHNILPDLTAAQVKMLVEKLKAGENSGFIEEPELLKKKNLPKPFKGGDINNILIIGDIHEPFCLEGYMGWCREIQEEYNCGRVVFIGDIIDNHYSSYHETDPDGYSAGEELDRAIDKIQDWYKVFPEATIIIGNHDRMAYRKAQTAGISKQWVRKYPEVLGTPKWTFVESIELYGIHFNHGEGGNAKSRMHSELQSQVQGHIHTDLYVHYSVGPKARVFGMQVGCGIDRHAYAMAYGKNFKKPAIGCGVVLNSGKLPIVIPMEL